MTTPLFNITASGLLVDGAEVAFPIPLSVLADRWGRPTRWENNGNVVLTWHELGIYSHAIDDDHVKTLCLLLQADPGGPAFSPTSTFAGTFLIDGASAEDRLPSAEESRRARLRADPTIAHGVKIYVDHDGDDLASIEMLSAVPAQRPAEPPVPRDRYEVRPAEGTPLTFAHLNFKLAVIDELMYQQEVLEPRFSLREFVRWFDGRTIDVEEEAGRPVPEALDYFARLEIDEAAAGQVRHLTIDAGNEIYHQITPQWDGEDDSFDIGSFDDVALLPHLTSIQFISLTPDDASVQALRARGITVDA